MTANPEQPVLDEIDRLVDWQLEEGRRRGDGPASTQLHTVRDRPWIPYREWFAPTPEDRTPAETALAWLEDSFPAAELWPVHAARGGSRSAPELDTINPATGEQPRH